MIDPFGLYPNSRSMLYGVQIIEAPEYPIYQLPKEIIPGVPWPPGFREEINEWSKEFIGTRSFLPPCTAYMIGGSMAVMRAKDIVKLSNLGI